jgi:hypothetical protein
MKFRVCVDNPRAAVRLCASAYSHLAPALRYERQSYLAPSNQESSYRPLFTPLCHYPTPPPLQERIPTSSPSSMKP